VQCDDPDCPNLHRIGTGESSGTSDHPDGHGADRCTTTRNVVPFQPAAGLPGGAQRHDVLVSKREGLDAQLSKLHHCKAVLRAERATTIDFTMSQARERAVTTAINSEGPPRPTFPRAS
jgi:hypothetical protein